jgi:hypothetical protein
MPLDGVAVFDFQSTLCRIIFLAASSLYFFSKIIIVTSHVLLARWRARTGGEIPYCLACPISGTVGWNPSLGIDVCVWFLRLCCPVSRGFAGARYPVEGMLQRSVTSENGKKNGIRSDASYCGAAEVTVAVELGRPPCKGSKFSVFTLNSIWLNRGMSIRS